MEMNQQKEATYWIAMKKCKKHQLNQIICKDEDKHMLALHTVYWLE